MHYTLDDPRLQEVIDTDAAKTAAGWPVDAEMRARLAALFDSLSPVRPASRAAEAVNAAARKRAA